MVELLHCCIDLRYIDVVFFVAMMAHGSGETNHTAKVK